MGLPGMTGAKGERGDSSFEKLSPSKVGATFIFNAFAITCQFWYVKHKRNIYDLTTSTNQFVICFYYY